MGRRILSISSALLLDLFSQGPHPPYAVVHDAVPHDAVIISVTYDPTGPVDSSRYGYITLTLASPSWEPIEPPHHLEPTVSTTTISNVD